jgi:UDP-3-O-[3-hydroxymyristoyl] glucosamine N-acyltransferase
MPFTAAEIAKHLQGQVFGDDSLILNNFAPADRAQAGDLTFAENEEYFSKAEQSAASAILVNGNFHSDTKVLIRVANPRVAFAKVLPLFFPERTFAPGIHPSAVVDKSAKVDPAAHIGPHCVIEANVQIGARTVLHSGIHVSENSKIGDDAKVFPNVTIYSATRIGNRVRIHSGSVIGSDGFGYVFDEGSHRKVPQIGNVIIHDDVEIGANVTIDRGALGPTVIGKGTKIDNLVQIAHNVQIGENCIIVAQAGISGSTKLGNYVTVAGQAGLAGHIKIGDGAIIAGQSGVRKDVGPGEKLWGSPAWPDKEYKRQVIALARLPELLKRVSELEKKLRPEE